MMLVNANANNIMVICYDAELYSAKLLYYIILYYIILYYIYKGCQQYHGYLS